MNYYMPALAHWRSGLRVAIASIGLFAYYDVNFSITAGTGVD
jgi:hypothetical protein